jgi:hydroxymethylglutaryl-CoA lyase
MAMIPKSVKICECWARDGIQGEGQFIPTQKKISVINKIIEAGFKRVEVTSFSHPKLVPQFSDCLEVLRGINRPKDVTFIAIIPNEKALDRLLTACDQGYGVHEITAIISASEDHLLANLEKTFSEALPPLASVVKRARAAGLQVIGCVGTSFGCPLSGEVPLAKVTELTDWYLQQGATSIMLGDTTGEANPLQVREVFGFMRQKFPRTDFIAHFHDTRGFGLANTLAALQEGVVYHDGSFGGIGGQPATRRPKYHKGFAGNACTEDLVLMMEEMGVQTGIAIEKMIDLVSQVEALCGRQLLGHVSRSGPIRHRSREPLHIANLYKGMEIPPTLFLHIPSISARQDGQPLINTVIRNSLEKNWPLSEKLTLSANQAKEPSEISQRTILVTRSEVVRVSDNEARLHVLSQKSDGDLYFEGDVDLIFP